MNSKTFESRNFTVRFRARFNRSTHMLQYLGQAKINGRVNAIKRGTGVEGKGCTRIMTREVEEQPKDRRKGVWSFVRK